MEKSLINSGKGNFFVVKKKTRNQPLFLIFDINQINIFTIKKKYSSLV